MSKIVTRDITEVDYEKVSEEYKSKRQNYGSNPVVKILIEDGAVLKVPLDTRTYKLGRYLKEKGYSLKKRKVEDSFIVWVEKDANENDD
jgi:hypothetical protein